MKKKTEAEYKAWLEEVRSKLPVGMKGKFDELVSDEEVGFNIFGGHLREADYYRKLNEMQEAQKEVEQNRQFLNGAVLKFKADVEEVKNWWETESVKNENLVNENDALKAQIHATRQKLQEYGLEDAAPVAPPAAGNSNENARLREELLQLKRYVIGMDRAVPQVLRQSLKTVVSGIKEGYDFDPDQLFDYTQQNGVDLPTAFERLTAEQRTARAAKAQEDAIAKAREEGRREALARAGSPDMIRPTGPGRTIEDMKNVKPTSPMERINQAVQAFYDQDQGKTGTL